MTRASRAQMIRRVAQQRLLRQRFDLISARDESDNARDMSVWASRGRMRGSDGSWMPLVAEGPHAVEADHFALLYRPGYQHTLDEIALRKDPPRKRARKRPVMQQHQFSIAPDAPLDIYESKCDHCGLVRRVVKVPIKRRRRKGERRFQGINQVRYRLAFAPYPPFCEGSP